MYKAHGFVQKKQILYWTSNNSYASAYVSKTWMTRYGTYSSARLLTTSTYLKQEKANQFNISSITTKGTFYNYCIHYAICKEYAILHHSSDTSGRADIVVSFVTNNEVAAGCAAVVVPSSRPNTAYV